MKPLLRASSRVRAKARVSAALAIALALGTLACGFCGCSGAALPEARGLELSQVLYQQIQDSPPESLAPACHGDGTAVEQRMGDLEKRMGELEQRTAELELLLEAYQAPARAMPKPTQETIVEFYTRAACPPCDTWKARELPRFEAAGITVQTIPTTSGTTPRFRILTGTRVIQHDGSLSLELFEQLVSPRESP